MVKRVISSQDNSFPRKWILAGRYLRSGVRILKITDGVCFGFGVLYPQVDQQLQFAIIAAGFPNRNIVPVNFIGIVGAVLINIRAGGKGKVAINRYARKIRLHIQRTGLLVDIFIKLINVYRIRFKNNAFWVSYRQKTTLYSLLFNGFVKV